jgi:hypothetical protein
MRFYLKSNLKVKRAGSVAEVVEGLPIKLRALSSNTYLCIYVTIYPSIYYLYMYMCMYIHNLHILYNLRKEIKGLENQFKFFYTEIKIIP